MALFPNVPDVPGVPPLLRPLGFQASVLPVLLTADTADFVPDDTTPQWGIFQNGFPVILADNVVDFAFRQDWDLSNYPQEEGAFQTYNKVNTPFDARVRFSAGGSESNRQAFLVSILSISGNLQLYDVVTPELIFANVNIAHVDNRRSARNGQGLVVVDVWLYQVPVTATAAFSQTKTPSGTANKSNGTVQPTVASPTQQSALSSIVSGP